jgi:hypothetical protein
MEKSAGTLRIQIQTFFDPGVAETLSISLIMPKRRVKCSFDAVERYLIPPINMVRWH